MGIIKILLIVIEVICSILLIGVILLQRAKGDGMGLAFGGGMGEAIFGSRTGNVLTRITIWLGGIFLASTVGLAMIYSADAGSRSLMQQRFGTVPASAPASIPAAAPEAGPAAALPGMSEVQSGVPGAPLEAVPAAPVEAAPAAPAPEAPAPVAPAP
jgi:protein translocase SecG subunit